MAAAVFAVDEKPQIQALNRTAPTLPMLPTTLARATHDCSEDAESPTLALAPPALQPAHPDLGSWMNMVERWFSALTTKKLQRCAQRSVKELAADIKAWVEVWNEGPKPFVWHKTAEQILERLAGYCAAINQGN